MADGWTALHYASMNGFARIVEYLVKEGGADVNV
jgi:ankyrin repeat protein